MSLPSSPKQIGAETTWKKVVSFGEDACALDPEGKPWCWGNNDRGVSVERGLELFQRIPGAEFHLFDKCAHWVQWDQADRFNRLVVDFLKGAS